MTVDIEAANRELAVARQDGKPCPPLRGITPRGQPFTARRPRFLR